MPQVGSTYSPYFATGPLMPTIMQDPTGVGSPLGVIPQTMVTQQKMPRSDRLEVCMVAFTFFFSLLRRFFNTELRRETASYAAAAVFRNVLCFFFFISVSSQFYFILFFYSVDNLPLLLLMLTYNRLLLQFMFIFCSF